MLCRNFPMKKDTIATSMSDHLELSHKDRGSEGHSWRAPLNSAFSWGPLGGWGGETLQVAKELKHLVGG